MLGLLDRMGVGGAHALEARRVLIVYTIGFAGFATHPPFEPGGVSAHSPEEMHANFDRGLRWQLAGIARGE